MDVIQLLVQKGLNLTAKTSDGFTALHCLCEHYTHENLIDLVQLLVEKGVDVQAKTSKGATAIELLNLNPGKAMILEEASIFLKQKDLDLIQLLGGKPSTCSMQ